MGDHYGNDKMMCWAFVCRCSRLLFSCHNEYVRGQCLDDVGIL